MILTEIQHNRPVHYEDSTHTYSLDGYRYISATQLVGRFKNKFDTPERATYMADRYGQTPEYWINKWNDIRYTSLERGTGIHNEREQWLYANGGLNTFHDSFGHRLPLINYPDGTYPELLLWRHDAQIAGRTDKCIITKGYTLPWTNDSFLRGTYSGQAEVPVIRIMDIEDYKTNRVLKTQSFGTKELGYLMMKGCLSHLQDCDINHYALQLSIYQYMAEYHGFFPGYRKIIHYQHPVEGIGTPHPKEYQLPYLRNEVIQMIETYAA